MGLEQGRQGLFALADAQGVLHAAEEFRHGVGVVARVGQGLDADAVGFDLVLAGEVDLPLHEQALATHQDRRRRVAGAASRTRGDGAQQHQGHQRRVLLRVLEGAVEMVLGDMADFMGDNACQLAFVAGDVDQARVHADIAARRRECVDLCVPHDEEREMVLRPVARGDETVAQVVDVLVEQGIVDGHVQRMHLAQHHGAVFVGLPRADEGVGGAAQVRQANVVLGPCGEGREGGGGKDEEAGKGHAHRSNDDTITQ